MPNGGHFCHSMMHFVDTALHNEAFTDSLSFRCYTCDTNDSKGSQRYISDPDDGDGLRSYTYNPNEGLRPGSYTSGQNDDTRLNSKACVCDGNWEARQLRRAVRRPQAVPGSTTGQVERLHGDASDAAAIAGDPISSTRLRDRPQRATKLPVRFRDCELL